MRVLFAFFLIWSAISLIFTHSSSSSDSDDGRPSVLPRTINLTRAHGGATFNEKSLYQSQIGGSSVDVKNSDGSIEKPTASTSRSGVVVTSKRPFDRFKEAGLTDPSAFVPVEVVGVPIFQTKALQIGVSKNYDQRQPVVPFKSGSVSKLFTQPGINREATLGDWENISGTTVIKCYLNGKSDVRISIKGFPHSTYTVWFLYKTGDDANPVGIGPAAYPNALVTDRQGCASQSWYLPYCPLGCGEYHGSGKSVCGVAYIVYLHFDNVALGGDADGTLYPGQWFAEGTTAGIQGEFILDGASDVSDDNVVSGLKKNQCRKRY